MLERGKREVIVPVTGIRSGIQQHYVYVRKRFLLWDIGERRQSFLLGINPVAGEIQKQFGNLTMSTLVTGVSHACGQLWAANSWFALTT
ncbi:hypothetical protein MLD38_011523 [Melastoma candidum]|uniref:Uncharacterized protein n=1 Tax=Melastoma candidum TaxID=119954 RepID=A0ACB9R3B4_9MYRT|nr:hypothetical protein MLD38_011523 [Melastoma candidum]